MNDPEVLLVLAPLVLLLAIGCELAWRNRYVPQWVARKVLHMGAIGTCALAPLLLDELHVLTAVVVASELLLIWLVITGRLFDQGRGSPSWGIMLFPIPYLLLLSYAEHRWMIALSMALLAFSDAMAAVAGTLWGRRFHSFTGDPRSLAGSLSCLVTSCIVLALFPSFRAAAEGLGPVEYMVLLLGIALLLTGVEALGSRGMDNFFIPLAAWAMVHKVSSSGAELVQHVHHLGLGLLGAALALPLFVRQRWLSPGGAVAAGVVGLWVIFFAGPLWLIPLFLFLAGSSVIGRVLRMAVSGHGDRKHGQPRDAVQVLCNGGVFAFAATFSDHRLAALGMAVSIAISAADTWASEIGIAWRGRTWDLLTGARVPPGLSGGISIPGTAGAFVAATTFAAVAMWLPGIGGASAVVLIGVAAGGVLGMFVDSLLGARFQPRYRNDHGRLYDVRVEGAVQVSGLTWMSNDMVNLLSNGLVTGLAVALACWLDLSV
jgi:uncharacterized protein (TIGR00297 family)